MAPLDYVFRLKYISDRRYFRFYDLTHTVLLRKDFIAVVGPSSQIVTLVNQRIRGHLISALGSCHVDHLP